MTFISLDNIIKLFSKYWDKFLIDGVSYTLLLSAITVGFGALLACLVAWMKTAKIAPVRWLATAYIEIIRGTPMLLQLYFFYFALPSHPRAQQAEVSVHRHRPHMQQRRLRLRGHTLGAAVGGRWTDGGGAQSRHERRAVHVAHHRPQALRTILPALGNEFVMIIKDTSLASTFFIGDLMTQYLIVKGATYLPIEPLVIVGVIYFLMTFLLSKLFGHFERKMSRVDR